MKMNKVIYQPHCCYNGTEKKKCYFGNFFFTDCTKVIITTRRSKTSLNRISFHSQCTSEKKGGSKWLLANKKALRPTIIWSE